ncbi:TPA: hypothetical protein I8235_000270 [Kluyvera intermedia]|nr:hypothetical protein [Kluyvera intermedia]
MSRGYFIINNSDVTGGIRAIVGEKFKAQAPPPEGREPATEPGWRRRRLIRATEDERVAPVSGRATGEFTEGGNLLRNPDGVAGA